jgi:ATPase subunit of ABC transporter with duplicated ATPase domains
MIDLKNLSHGFGSQSLFENVSLRFLDGERYGVVGANGSGKSTLLKIICGEIEPDAGSISAESHAELFRIGQDHALNDQGLIIDAAMMGQALVFDAIKRKDALLSLADQSSEEALEIAHLEDIIARHQGYRLSSQAAEILEGLGIKSALHHDKLSTLSGGYKWRVFLAQALVKKPAVLLLDEPTNHLDIISIRWLELFLARYDGLVILVSHDKRFMDNVCTRIMDVDFSTIREYAGNYTAFEQSKALFLAQKEKEIESQEQKVAHLQSFVDRFKAKASKARQAQSRVKQIERMEVIEPVKSSRMSPHFSFLLGSKGPKEILDIKHLNKSFGNKTVIADFSLKIMRGEKIAVIGANGTGKSTLVKAIAGEFLELNEAIKFGQGVELGYFAQELGQAFSSSSQSMLEWLWQFCADKPQSFVQGLLGRMLFSKDEVKKRLRDLSGGERARLYFAYIMFKSPNFLMLDEPTNHLDLETIEALINALKAYEGTLLFVSHDRIFIEALAERIIEMKESGSEEFLGSYREYIHSKHRDYLDAEKEISSLKQAEPKRDSAQKTNFEEQKQKKALIQKLNKKRETSLKTIEELEVLLKHIEEKFLEPGFFSSHSHEAIAQIDQEKQALAQKLASAMSDWEAIEEELANLE